MAANRSADIDTKVANIDTTLANIDTTLANIDNRLGNIEIRVNDIAGTFLLCCISELVAESGVDNGRYPREICRP